MPRITTLIFLGVLLFAGLLISASAEHVEINRSVGRAAATWTKWFGLEKLKYEVRANALANDQKVGKLITVSRDFGSEYDGSFQLAVWQSDCRCITLVSNNMWLTTARLAAGSWEIDGVILPEESSLVQGNLLLAKQLFAEAENRFAGLNLDL